MIVETITTSSGALPSRSYTKEEFLNSAYESWIKTALTSPTTPPLTSIEIKFGEHGYLFEVKP